jgi:hypothetical protein
VPAVPGLWNRYRALALPAAVIVALLGLATIPYPFGLRVSGRLIASSVSLTVSEPTTVHAGIELRPPRASITGAAAIELPPGLGGKAIGKQVATVGATLTAEDGSLLLSTLTLGPDLDLTVQHGPHEGLTLLIGGAESTVEFEVGGKMMVAPEGTRPISADLDPPEIVTVLGRASAVPTGIQIRVSRDPLVLGDLLVSRIAFTRALSAGGRGSPFVSSVLSGTVQLVDTARSEPLEIGAALALDDFKGWVVHLESTTDGIALSFTGRARHVRAGPLGHPDDLTPSTLAYLFHQEWINMLWIGTLGGIALLAKVRAWAVGKLED